MAPDEASATLAARLDVIRAHADLDGPHFNPNFTCDVHVPRLLAALDIAQAALARHQQWFTDSSGIRICGGCLKPVPCKDTDVIGRALAGKDSSDE